MSLFTPPGVADVPALVVDTRGPVRRLARYFRAGTRGRTVYYLSDGSVTETDPDSSSVFWTRSEGSPYVVTVWWGSTASPYTVTSAQAAALVAAGYTVT